MTMEDETTVLLQRGYRAICIAGRDPITSTLPHRHRPDDTPDTVSEKTMKQAAEFVMAVLREMDDITSNQQPATSNGGRQLLMETVPNNDKPCKCT